MYPSGLVRTLHHRARRQLLPAPILLPHRWRPCMDRELTTRVTRNSLTHQKRSRRCLLCLVEKHRNARHTSTCVPMTTRASWPAWERRRRNRLHLLCRPHPSGPACTIRPTQPLHRHLVAAPRPQRPQLHDISATPPSPPPPLPPSTPLSPGPSAARHVLPTPTHAHLAAVRAAVSCNAWGRSHIFCLSLLSQNPAPECPCSWPVSLWRYRSHA